MTATEWLGALISILALTYFVFRKIKEEAGALSSEGDAQAKREQEERLRKFLMDLNEEMREEPSPLPPPPKPIKIKREPVVSPQPVFKKQLPKETDFSFTPKLEHYRTQSALETRKLASALEDRYQKSFSHLELAPEYAMRKEGPSRIEKKFFSLTSKKDLIIFNEILASPPKGLKFPL